MLSNPGRSLTNNDLSAITLPDKLTSDTIGAMAASRRGVGTLLAAVVLAPGLGAIA